MNNLNSIDSRDKSRRIVERRSTCRRVIKHPFGSAKWIQAVQASYLLWPRQDRRDGDRRCVSRRMAERRIGIQNSRRWSVRQRVLNNTVHNPVLTAEEISMLRDLSRRL